MIALIVLTIRGSLGVIKKTSGMISTEASKIFTPIKLRKRRRFSFHPFVITSS